MRFKLFFFPLLVVSLLAPALPALSQAAPAYRSPGAPLSIGVGYSNFDPDWGQGRMWGGTAWADWYPSIVSSHLHGLGFEVEARDISVGQNLPTQFNVRQDTAEAGLIYPFHLGRKLRPYVKGLGGLGSEDFTSPNVHYSHDTRTLVAVGGGVDYRVIGPLWARADYGYQIWQELFGHPPTPNGFTVGLSYDFGHGRGH